MATELKDIEGKLDQKRVELDALFEKKNDAGLLKWEPADHEAFNAIEKESKSLRGQADIFRRREAVHADADELKNEIKKVNRPGMFPGGLDLDALSNAIHGGGPSQASQFAKAVTGHGEFKKFSLNHPVSIRLDDFDFSRVVAESKTVMTTAAGFAAPQRRSDMLVDYPLRRPMVGDLIPTDTVGPGQADVRWMEETTFTNNAAPVAEGASKPESAINFTERTNRFEKIATTLPVTDEQAEDVPTLEQIIRSRLILMVLLTEEDQLLNGTGTSPELQGFLTKSGVLTQAAAGDPTPDVLLKAMTKVAVTGRASASGMVLHPTDSMNMRLLRTADGTYIFGSPAGPSNFTVWGVTPVVTDEMTLGSALVGDFQGYSHITRRKQVVVDIGFVNDDFKRNQRTFRCEIRESLEIYRASAFCVASGLA